MIILNERLNECVNRILHRSKLSIRVNYQPLDDSAPQVLIPSFIQIKSVCGKQGEIQARKRCKFALTALFAGNNVSKGETHKQPVIMPSMDTGSTQLDTSGVPDQADNLEITSVNDFNDTFHIYVSITLNHVNRLRLQIWPYCGPSQN